MYFTFSFTQGTETKSGRVIKTPGKYSTCVSGKRKPHRGKKSSPQDESIQQADFPQMDLTSMANDVTSSSLLVNTSQFDAADETETDIYHEEDTTLETDITQFTEEPVHPQCFVKNEW